MLKLMNYVFMVISIVSLIFITFKYFVLNTPL